MPEIKLSRIMGFTVIELLIVIGIIAILAVAVILVLRPVEFLRQSRDAKRLNDIGVINSAINLILVTSNGVVDFDGPLFSNTCYGDSNQKVYVSVPSDNGEIAPTLPIGWSWAQVSSSNLYRIDGSGWIPVNFGVGGAGLGAKFPVLPIDPTNTFASGQYFTYVCDPELTTSLESEKLKPFLLSDGGDDINAYEAGNKLYITPLRNSSSTQIAGLVASYNFNGTVNDSSGNGNHGALNGGATVLTISMPGFGSALYLDGVDDYVDGGVNASIGMGPATWTAWINRSNTGQRAILSKSDNNVNIGWVVAYRNNLNGDKVGSDTLYSGGTGNVRRYGTAPSNGTWYHLAVVYSGNGIASPTDPPTNVTVYVNGAEVSSYDPSLTQNGDVTHNSDISKPLWIGRTEWAGIGYYEGLIDNVRIYNRVLSPAEILTDYNTQN